MSNTADLRAALDTLRDALTAALPSMPPEQQAAADALLAALAPPMEEPTWPGAPVIAACPGYDHQWLHVRRNDDEEPGWECNFNCTSVPWYQLVNPRPLTDDERAKYGIPGECERPHAEPITGELVERCIEASTFMYPAWVRAVLRAAGHPEAGE